MRTIELSNIQWIIAATLVVAAAGCDGEIRPPKNRPADSAPAAPPPAGTAPAPAGAGPATANMPGAGSGDARAIGTLSTRELVDVCRGSNDNVARAVAAQVQIECTASALNQSGGCSAARDKCIAQSKPDEDDQVDCEMEAAQLAQDCATVSIAALRGCEQAWIRKLEGIAKQLDCSTSLERIRQISDRDSPPECQTVDTRCRDQKM